MLKTNNFNANAIENNTFTVPEEWRDLLECTEISFKQNEVMEAVKWDGYHRPFNIYSLKKWVELYKLIANTHSRALMDNRQFPDLESSEDIVEVAMDMAAGIWSIINNRMYWPKVRRYISDPGRFWKVGIYYTDFVAPPNWLVALFIRRLIDCGFKVVWDGRTAVTYLNNTPVRVAEHKTLAEMRLTS